MNTVGAIFYCCESAIRSATNDWDELLMLQQHSTDMAMEMGVRSSSPHPRGMEQFYLLSPSALPFVDDQGEHRAHNQAQIQPEAGEPADQRLLRFIDLL